VQPGPCEPPVVRHGGPRHAQRVRGLGNRESREHTAFDDARQPLVESCERVDRRVDRENVFQRDSTPDDALRDGGQRDPLTLTLVRRPSARVVDEDAAHRARRGAEEMRAVLERLPTVLQELEPDLVHQLRRMQGVIGSLASKMTPGQPPELRVGQREQRVEAGVVASWPQSDQYLGDIRLCHRSLRAGGHVMAAAGNSE
jgi:hypothetical protein